MVSTERIRQIGLICISMVGICFNTSAQWDPNFTVATSSGKYAFSYTQIPDNLVEINPPFQGTPPDGLLYQWQECFSPTGTFVNAPSGGQATYVFSGPLTQTTYFLLKVSAYSGFNVILSNIIKIQVVSVNWEDINYIKEHDVLVPGITDWQTVDQLPIGQKLQSTVYADGMGRSIQSISVGTAAPPATQPDGAWGDIVNFSIFDAFGQKPLDYLSYTTTTEPGKLKSSPLTEQPQYYSSNLNETSAFTNSTFDNSPMSRTVNVKPPGTSWAAGPGISISYLLNDAQDNVQIFNIGFNTGDLPVSLGAFPANSLYKTIHTDELHKQTIVYTDMIGKVILTKEQLDDNPGVAHTGWICTYNVYDDFGLLRYQIQPEGVKWLDANGWAFTGTDGQQAQKEFCFRYEYDDKRRLILKKVPGADEQYMIYDKRDRLVFNQDGNQRQKLPGEWQVSLYDDMDRVVLTALYETSETSSNLQSDISNAANITTVSVPSAVANDLEVVNRNPTVTQYVATKTITFDAGFQSATGDQFQTLIDPNATGGSQSLIVFGSPVPPSVISDPTKFTPVRLDYYDNYNFPGAKPFNNAFSNGLAYSTSDATVIPLSASQRTLSMPTGSSIRVLSTANFMVSSVYYDEMGRQVQISSDNVLSGTDVTTNQYHFDGRILSTDFIHNAPGTLYTNFDILTKYLYDKVGRVSGVQKKFGANDFKTVATYDLDDMGRTLTRHLDPGYMGTNGSGLESQTYSYNIHGQITGINKDYALKTPGKYDKWVNFFGQYLGFDNLDGVFSAGRLDGKITGSLWSTQGDDVQRKYDFDYDNVGRLTKALYLEKQHPGDSWSNTAMDFSITGRFGEIQYDLNGNLLYMLQKGVLVGTQSPLNVDDLQYNYTHLSNKLSSVSDNSTMGAQNGKLGDFADGNNGSADDYVFDNNGNVVVDLNKNITQLAGATNNYGISYNFLDKPEQIHIAGKGTVRIIYDASGNKLQKIFMPEAGGASVTTTNIQAFVYQGNTLQYINFEEGRVRVMQPVSQNNGYDMLTLDGNIDLPGGQRGAYDFFIRDFQQNIRMIVTEETDLGSNSCTMETDRASVEESLFGKVDANGTPTTDNEVKARFPVTSIPGQSSGGGWQNAAIGNYVSRVGRLAGNTMGPNALLRVMAGDQVSAKSLYYYPQPTGTITTQSMLSDMLMSLAGALIRTGATTNLVHGVAGNITTNLSNNLGGNSFIDPGSTTVQTSNTVPPSAFLYVLFFDERMNFVPDASTSLQVSQPSSSSASLVLPNVKAPKNGYAFVYVCNASDQMVYFDNLQVTNNHGAIIEEDHYYSYGLKIAAISSQKMPDPNEGFTDNKDLYNNKELIDDGGLNWYDYGFRNFDPQIGRFVQLDPLSSSFPYMTPYQYASCDPIKNVDLDGQEGSDGTLPAVVIRNIDISPGASMDIFKRLISGITPAFLLSSSFGNNAIIYGYVNELGNPGWFDNHFSDVMCYHDQTWTYVCSVQISQAPTLAEKQAAEAERVYRLIHPNYARVMGALEAGRDGLLDVLNVLNMSARQNTLVKLWNYYSIPEPIRNEMLYYEITHYDYSDPTNQGRLLFHAVTVVAPIIGPASGLVGLTEEGTALASTEDALSEFTVTDNAVADVTGFSDEEVVVDGSTSSSSELDTYYSKLKEAQAKYPNKAGKIEWHHITSKYLGGDPDGPLIPLDGAYHQQITNEFRALYPYRQPFPALPQLRQIMSDVYAKYPLPYL